MIQFSSGANQLFSKLDTDRNGVSIKELQDLVKKADGAGQGGKADGQLTADEINAALKDQGIQVELKPEDLKAINAVIGSLKNAEFEPSMVVFQRMGGKETPEKAMPLPDELRDYVDAGMMTTAETGSVTESQIQEMIRDIQRRLIAMGYENAKETGALDDNTMRLIRDLQEDHGLETTGRWNPDLARRAEAIANLPRSNDLSAAAAEEVPRVASEIASLPASNRLAQAAADVAGDMGTRGYCYRGVKQAIRRATGVYLEGASAWMAANQLASNPKFKEVQVNRSDLTKLPPGAVVVWPKTGASPHGHISVALGGGKEASDHVQNQITNLRNENMMPRVFIPNT